MAGTEQPVTFLAEVHFDGNGNVVSQMVGDASPLASFSTDGYLHGQYGLLRNHDAYRVYTLDQHSGPELERVWERL